jgi:hypothetical protein
MPMGTSAAAQSASIFDDESEDREGDMRQGQMRGMAFQYTLLLLLRFPLTPVEQCPLRCPQRSTRACFRRSKTLMTCNTWLTFWCNRQYMPMKKLLFETYYLLNRM